MVDQLMHVPDMYMRSVTFCKHSRVWQACWSDAQLGMGIARMLTAWRMLLLCAGGGDGLLARARAFERNHDYARAIESYLALGPQVGLQKQTGRLQLLVTHMAANQALYNYT